MSRNRRPTKTWKVSYGGQSLLVDDLTMDELEALEQSTGVSWSLLNPHNSVAQAQGFLALLLIRDGKTDEEAREAIKAMTVRDFKGVFELVEDDRPTYYGEADVPVVGHPPAPESSTST